MWIAAWSNDIVLHLMQLLSLGLTYQLHQFVGSHIQKTVSLLVLKLSIVLCEANVLCSTSFYHVANLMQLLASHRILAVIIWKVLLPKAVACGCSVQL